MSKQRVTATFEVGAGAYGECEIDIAGLSPDEIAERVFVGTEVDIDLCHQCAHRVKGPEVMELTGFTVGGVEYSKVDGRWASVGVQL